MNKEKHKIDSCPNCGGKDILVISEWATMSSAEVRCDDCEFSVRESLQKDALKAWNNFKSKNISAKEHVIKENKQFLEWAERDVIEYKRKLKLLHKCDGKIPSALF